MSKITDETGDEAEIPKSDTESDPVAGGGIKAAPLSSTFNDEFEEWEWGRRRESGAPTKPEEREEEKKPHEIKRNTTDASYLSEFDQMRLERMRSSYKKSKEGPEQSRSQSFERDM